MTDDRDRQARRNAVALVRAHLEEDAEATTTLLLPDEHNPNAVVDTVNALLAFAAELVKIQAPAGDWRRVLDELALRAADERCD